MHSLFECVTLCHSAIVKDKEFFCNSEDERALLHAARKIGYNFLSRKKGEIRVKHSKRVHYYNVITTFPFDSTRKMMSVVLKTEDGEYVMFSKGADTAMYPRLKENED